MQCIILLQSDRGHSGIACPPSLFILILSFEFEKAVDDFIGFGFQLFIEVLLHLLLQFIIRAVQPEVALSKGRLTWYLRRELVDSLAVSKMLYLLAPDICLISI